jgi:membrane protein
MRKMRKRLNGVFRLLNQATIKYKKDDPVRLSGTAAYFIVFAMAPIIVIIVSILGILMGKETIQEKIFVEINTLIGEKGTQYIMDLIENFQDTKKGILGSII